MTNVSAPEAGSSSSATTTFRTMLEHSANVVWVLDAEGRIRYSSPSSTHVLGWKREDLVGQKAASVLIPPEELDLHAAILTHAAAQRGKTVDIELQLLRADGGRIWVNGTANDLTNEPDVGGIVITVRDVTRQRELTDQLTQRSMFDELTGLPTRALFADRLTQAISLSSYELIVKVLFINIDKFREVNTILGYAAADDLLRQVSQRITEVVPEGSIVGRNRADQFLIAEVCAQSNRGELIGGLNRSFAQPFPLGDKTYRISASIGLATATQGEATADEVIRKAETAAHAAKEHGNGQAMTYSQPLDARSMYRRETESQLHLAIDDDQLRVHYQPVMHMETNTPAGVEALVRWEHPTRGLVPPSEFITIAEETGMIVPIGAWVLDQTIATITKINANRSDKIFGAVNLSPRQLHDPDFVSMLGSALSRGEICGSLLNLDITEAALRGNQALLGDRLSRINSMGVKLAIDDFGTGYSSLSHLRSVPATYLKIDRTFTSEITGAGRDVVAGLITLAHAFGLIPIAEGVETEEELHILTELGCRYSQGYYHARPLPLADLEDYFRQGGARE